MKITTHSCKKLLLLSLLMLSYSGFAQVEGANFKLTLGNPSFPSPTTLDFDVNLVVNHTGTALADGGIKIGNLQYGINFNPAILNGGTPSTAPNGGSFVLLPGTRDAVFNGLDFSGVNGVGSYRGLVNGYGQLRVIGTLVPGSSSVLIPNGTYRIGRYRFTNTVAFTGNGNAQLWINDIIKSGSTAPAVTGYKNGTTTPSFVYGLSSPAAAPGLTVGYTQDSTLGVENQYADANSVLIFKKDEALHINAGKALMNSVQIFDVRGRLLLEVKDINASATVINNLKAEQQVLVVNIDTDSGLVTKKVSY
ncbi:T9SS sorting signal type C domain-containing protein [Flavobacterium sp. 3HN19-14]|uniref:T9SS sorting signal type C domain-containing protein n=1 Tax=Flavobacterium sp. 3HN19-14 TaxID=3448133 RepID=UPI003EE128C1